MGCQWGPGCITVLLAGAQPGAQAKKRLRWTKLCHGLNWTTKSLNALSTVGKWYRIFGPRSPRTWWGQVQTDGPRCWTCSTTRQSWVTGPECNTGQSEIVLCFYSSKTYHYTSSFYAWSQKCFSHDSVKEPYFHLQQKDLQSVPIKIQRDLFV